MFGDGSMASGQLVQHCYSSTGSFTVTLAVEDNASLTDTDDALVEVSTVSHALTGLLQSVIGLELKKGLEQALSASLEAALISVDNDRPSAVNQLLAFINKVEAMRGAQLTDTEADTLVSDNT
jgi:PKD repeat protein